MPDNADFPLAGVANEDGASLQVAHVEGHGVPAFAGLVGELLSIEGPNLQFIRIKYKGREKC